MTQNNKSFVFDINQLMHQNPHRLVEWINAGACLQATTQVTNTGINSVDSSSQPPFANYDICRLIGTADIYQCRYDRDRARQYALKWGSSDVYKDATPGMSVGAGTDCTNFASQVLAAGGFRPTENWYYLRTATTEQIGSKSPAWTGVDWFLSWLTGTPRSGISDIQPLANASGWSDIDVDDLDSVLAVAQTTSNLNFGDMIFYFDSFGVLYDHVSIIVGWGSPYNFKTGSIQYASPSERVPWIVDHGESNYPGEGRVRPFNYQRPYAERSGIKVQFVHIPDIFSLHRIKNNGIWDW